MGSLKRQDMNIDDYLTQFINGNGKSQGRQPEERYASFDYCFNYFQQFKDDKTLPDMADEAHMQLSCLHLSFYLASWGMFRGSSFLLEKSAKFFEPLVCTISSMDESIWNVDADKYTDDNIALLIRCANSIADKLGKANKPNMLPEHELKIHMGFQRICAKSPNLCPAGQCPF